LFEVGELTNARNHLERALKIGEQVYGTTHPNLASVLKYLGVVSRDLGDQSAARQYLERALRIAEATYGTDHPLVATIRAPLAALE
jgi:tetratricopeptide (TPR) repeat protein